MNLNFDDRLNSILSEHFYDSLELSKKDILQIKSSIDLYEALKKQLEEDYPLFGKKRKLKHLKKIQELDAILQDLYNSLLLCENDMKFYNEIFEKKILE